MAYKTELDAQVARGVGANGAGCLDACERGMAVCVYPDNVWYGPVSKDDVKEIVSTHIKGGQVVERLVMKLPIDRKKD